MDSLGVHHMKRTKNTKKRSDSKRDLRVVYISSPMKVKTCASQFRALVQQLTGKDSNVADRFMDSYDYDSVTLTPENSPTNRDTTSATAADDGGDGVIAQLPSFDYDTNQSVFDPFDDGVMSEVSFLRMFTSNFFHDPSQLDAITSFGSV